MKLDEKKKTNLFLLAIFTVIQISCYNLYFIISAITGDFNWTIERLTTTTVGILVQIIDLILTVNGVLLFLFIVIALFQLLRKK
jgi:TRAP-type C4-dicarboxylate transport system permease small subunit